MIKDSNTPISSFLFDKIIGEEANLIIIESTDRQAYQYDTNTTNISLIDSSTTINGTDPTFKSINYQNYLDNNCFFYKFGTGACEYDNMTPGTTHQLTDKLCSQKCKSDITCIA